MKNNFIKLILIVCVFWFTSCDSELDQQPNNAFSTSTFYNSLGDFENATRGLYAGFYGGGYYGSSLLSRPDIMTDNVILAPAGRRSNQFFNEWRYVANAAWDMMFSPYVVTNRANLIIENISNIDGAAEQNNFLGEARAARAIAMFDMLRVYSKIPTQGGDANTSLGMPIITGTDPAVRELRPTVAESYQFVIDELEAARGLINTDNGVGRLNLNAVNAMLSRVYLYNGDYGNTITAANNVSTPVASISTFSGIWTDSNADGVVFKLDQDRVLDNIGIGIAWSQSNAGAIIPEYVVSFELFNLYQNTDVRKNAYTQVQADNDGNLYNSIVKMFGEVGQNNGAVDAKVIRAAEVYLNKAEAHSMLGQDGLALTALDMVRSNRYSGFVSGNETGANLLEAIRLERRLELFAEGHRFFDLKRWNMPVNRSATDGEFFDGTGTPAPSGFLTLPAGDTKFLLPIPQREINIFPTFQQNPGY